MKRLSEEKTLIQKGRIAVCGGVIEIVRTGQRLVVGSQPQIIGRRKACHLAVLGDDSVSGHHLEVQAMARGVRIRDLGSTNGTKVGGVELIDGVLTKACEFHIGDTLARFHPTEPEEIRLSGEHQLDEMIGATPIMQQVFDTIRKLGASELSVLITGPTGSGKELAARALHRHSARKDGPFVAVSCKEINDNLIESELFGHERNAFTGAGEAKKGLIRAAEGGTLFLDEVGTMSRAMQEKLLRVLGERRVRPVGSEAKEIPFDVRFVFATWEDLQRKVETKDFREDLYFRIRRGVIELPPLIDRMGDLQYLIKGFFDRRDRRDVVVDGVALGKLMSYSWPGNVRELESVLEVSLAMGTPQSLAIDTAFKMVSANTRMPVATNGRRIALDEAERRFLLSLWGRCDGNVSEMARQGNVPIPTMRRRLIRHGILKPQERVAKRSAPARKGR